MAEQPGVMVLFGSGERAPSAQRIYDWVMQGLDPPIRVSVLETPAGFELNSDQVAAKVADFVRERLQNYHPQVEVLPARKKGTPNSPDNPEVLAPMLRSNMVFMGPGSPTYAIRQLRDSLAWQMLKARHRLGAAIVLASAATISVGCCALPVYEIYKVGEDPFWNQGLDFWGDYGLSLAFVSHWDNNDGGDELDTSRCFMGQPRFARLLELLPEGVMVVGIDEHTALIMDPSQAVCHVMGRGGVTLLRGGDEEHYKDGASFPLSELGAFSLPDPREGIDDAIWTAAQEVQREMQNDPQAPPEVLALVEDREEARSERDWPRSDALREQIEAQGWQVMDTPDGPLVTPK